MILLQTIPFIRAFLGCVLLLSGIGKLLDRAGTLDAIGRYGVPPHLRRKVARLLPFLELGIGTGLVLQLVPLLFSSIALVTFSVFLIGVVQALSHGATMDCHCFGALTREPVGTATVARLALLILLTCIVVGTDLLILKMLGFVFQSPGIETPRTLVPIATTASIGAVGMLVLHQLVITLRTIRNVERL